MPSASGCIKLGRVKWLGVFQLHWVHREEHPNLFILVLPVIDGGKDFFDSWLWNRHSHMSYWLFLRWLLHIRGTALRWSIMGHADGVRPDVVVTMSALFIPRPGGQIYMDLSHHSPQKGSTRVSCLDKLKQSVVHAGLLAKSQMFETVCIKLLWNSWVGQSFRNMAHVFQINCSSVFYCLALVLLDSQRMLTQQTNALGFNCHLTVCLIFADYL